MNEKINRGLSPEEEKEKEAQEEAELLEYNLARYPESIISPENLREAGPEIIKFETLVTLFESAHSLVELNSISELTPQEASEHTTREPARVALYPIVELLDILKNETNISVEKYEELKAKYKLLSRAVGMINNNKVDHNR